MNYKILLLAATCLWAGYSTSGRAQRDAAPTPRTIVVFGDSITAGSALAEKDRDKLWLRVIERDGHGTIKMVNEGKGGRPTASRSDFDAMLARQPRIDLLVIALGMNDSRDITVSCVPKAVANVRYMIERARQTCGAALPILLVGPSNINKAALGPTKPIARQREAKLRELGDGFANLVKETNCDFVNLFGVVPESDLSKDGVHPDVAGNAAIAAVMKRNSCHEENNMLVESGLGETIMRKTMMPCLFAFWVAGHACMLPAAVLVRDGKPAAVVVLPTSMPSWRSRGARAARQSFLVGMWPRG